MIYATFLFNIIYGTEATSSILDIIIKLLSIIPLIVLSIIISITNYKKEFKIYFYVLLFINSIAICVGYSYLHYYMILVPLYAVLFSQIKFNKNIAKIIAIIYTAIIYLLFIYYLHYNENLNYTAQQLNESEVLELLPYIEDKNSVLAYDVPAKIYLFMDITPAYKYFVFQSWHAQSKPQIKNEMQDLFNSKTVKYIITYNNGYSFDNYKIIYTNNTFCLYELN